MRGQTENIFENVIPCKVSPVMKNKLKSSYVKMGVIPLVL